MITTTQNNFKNFFKSSSWGWCLFDFANSIPAVIGGIYFAKWFTEDVGASSIAFNLLFFVSAIVIILSGKWVGKRIDTDGYKFWIKLSSGITFIAIFSLFLTSQFLPKVVILPISFLFFVIFLFGYQVSRICHNVYLRGVIPEEIQSKMSGLGTAANWAGSITGIGLTIPVIMVNSGTLGRELTFLVASIGYGILTPISLYFMFLSKPNSNLTLLAQNQEKITWKSLLSSIGILLLIYLLLFDVMATVQRNLPLYLSQIFKMPDNTQALGFLLILFSAMVGGFLAAKSVQYKNSKAWLIRSSLLLAFSIMLITIHNNVTLWIAFITAGLSYGIMESSIRVNFMGTFSPVKAGENFGILAVVERTSGVIGPLIWIIPFTIFSDNNNSYIFSMYLMALISFVAFLLLFCIKKVKHL